MTQRGSLLISEMPSILKNYGDEFLRVSFNIDGKIIESNLQDELLLGDGKFDPFAVMEALDKVPAIIAFWSTLLVEIKERLHQHEQQLKILEANAKEFCSNLIMDQRPEGAKKMPSQAEVDNKYASLFLIEDMKPLMDTQPGGEILGIKTELNELSAKAADLESKANKIEIVYTAWRDRSYMLTTQASLMETLIKNELIKIPKDRRVYENWG